MSKSGGIAYLIKHGRAPSPVATRTKMTGKRYAAGGPPINNSLGYMTLDAAGKPVYHSGKFVRKTATAPAGAGTGIAAIAPATGSGNRSGYEEGGGGGSGWRDTS